MMNDPLPMTQGDWSGLLARFLQPQPAAPADISPAGAVPMPTPRPASLNPPAPLSPPAAPPAPAAPVPLPPPRPADLLAPAPAAAPAAAAAPADPIDALIASRAPGMPLRAPPPGSAYGGLNTPTMPPPSSAQPALAASRMFGSANYSPQPGVNAFQAATGSIGDTLNSLAKRGLISADQLQRLLATSQ